jgi:predicted nuclease of restriction endonuclease-like (RecB) superfamily
MSGELLPKDYAQWLSELKARIHQAQQRSTLSVNRELIKLYWQLGKDILARQGVQGWGAKVIERLALDLRASFPEMKGFSRANLLYMRAFAQAWPDPEFVQQAVGHLPWGHNIVLLTRLKSMDMRLAYAQQAIEHGWSRNVLSLHIETQRLERSGQAVSNFDSRLPAALSDLARESLKDPYRLDFLGLAKEAEERAIESALVTHITQFLIELGSGFAYVGRQVHIEVGGDDFFIDLLFYHLKLRCYVVIELKAGPFKPEHTGKLSFYLSAIDAKLKHADDQATIGILLCKSKNSVVAEYALRDTTKPIGIAEYQLVQSLPESLKTNLPSIEEIEAELASETLPIDDSEEGSAL